MTDSRIAKKNARLAVVTAFLANLAFTLPIWVLFSINELKFSPTLAVALSMSIWITSAVLEIPTGALADRLGRKKIYIIGASLYALYPLAYIFALPVPLFLLTCIIAGAGHALYSGTVYPMVHRAYEEAGFDKQTYNNFRSNAQVATFVGRVVSGVIGAGLYALNPTWPYMILFLTLVLHAVLGAFFVDFQNKVSATTNTAHIMQTLRKMKSSLVIRSVIVTFILFNLVAEAQWTGYQVFFEADGRASVTIGVLFSIIAVCSAIGAYSVRHLAKRLHPVRLMQLFGFGVLATAALLFQPNETLRLFAILPMGFVSGITIFTLDTTVQHNLKNLYHSTALSVVSFTQYMTYALGSLVFGVSMQLLGVDTTRLVILISALVACGYVALLSIVRPKLSEYNFALSADDKIN